MAKNRDNAQKQKRAQGEMPKEKIVLRMIGLNRQLSTWRAFVDNGGATGSYYPSKSNANTAQIIFNSLSHPDAVEIIAHEWETFLADIRMLIGTLCRNPNASNSVKKGIQILDQKLGGKLLRDPNADLTVRVAGKDMRVNPAIAGAARKYGITTGQGLGFKGNVRTE